MKRVLIVSLAYYPHVGGAEVAIKEITARLNDIEFEMVTLRFGRDPKEERIGNVLVHRVGFGSAYLSKILFAPLAALAARRLHKRKAFDGAWAMMSYMTLPLAFLRVLGVRVPYVLTLQEGDTEAHMFGRLRILPFLPLISAGFRRARVVQAISTYLGTWARKRGFSGPLEIIPNGVDIQNFSRPEGYQISFKDPPTLITSSRLVHKNGVDTIIRALALMPQARFVVCGTGGEEPALKALAKELGVEGRIHWLGHVDHADLPRHLHRADIFVRPSRSEGMGNSFVEAFAAGLPVIATQEGGIADLLFDARRNPDKPATGWAVDKNNPAQIAEAVGEIVANPERARGVVENARRLAFSKYDWDLITKDMRDRVFAKVL